MGQFCKIQNSESQENALMIGEKDFAGIVAEHGDVDWNEVSRAESD